MFTYSLAGLQVKEAESGPVEVEENETTARSGLYQVLARLFSLPDEDHYDRARDGRWAKEMAHAAALLPFAFEIGEAPLPAEVDRAGWLAEHDRVFGAGGVGGALLREGHDAADADAMVTEVRREYDYFGLGLDGSALPPDHLSTECDFMQYLAFREAATASDRLRTSFRRAQRDFLDHHLVGWVPTLVAEADAKEPIGPLSWALGRLDEFVRADHAYLNTLLAG